MQSADGRVEREAPTCDDGPVKVTALWRYPVKSMQGEALSTAEVGPVGIVGDRGHALRDSVTGVVLTARRDPSLLFASGRVEGPDAVVHLPDGHETADDDVLSDWIGRPVELIGPSGHADTYEIPADPEDDDSEILTWQGPAWSFHDSTRTQMSLVATGDLADWEVRRFRPNLVLQADTADRFVGHRLRFGTVEVDVVKHIDRCVIVTRPQPGGIDRDLEVLRTVKRERNLMLGVGAMVRVQGEVAVGDPAEDLGPF
ncbi:MAG: MOSC N-terminal beta barrel domain-containing protein [Aquihabitans sp.]